MTTNDEFSFSTSRIELDRPKLRGFGEKNTNQQVDITQIPSMRIDRMKNNRIPIIFFPNPTEEYKKI